MNCTFLSVAAATVFTFAETCVAQDKAITADGSSTVEPITSAVTAEFVKTHPDVRVSVGVSGTSGGFRRFLVGETDISNASRAIKKEEIEKAAKAGIEYLECLVAFDGLTIAVAKNTEIFGKDKPVLTMGELELLWSREAEGVVTSWKHLGSRFADAKIVLSGAASTSGTFDFLTEVVNHKAGDTRADYFATEEDQVLAEQTSKNVHALTYFGYAFYLHNQERVQPIAIDPRRTCVDAPADILAQVNEKRAKNGKKPIANGEGDPAGVLPDVDTIGSNAYQPLTRPLFVYVNKKSAARAEVKDLLNFYLDEKHIGNREFVLDVGYVTAQRRLRDASRAIFSGMIPGSAFGGEFGKLTPALIAEKYTAHAKAAATPSEASGKK
ncbi:MAG: phosphate ABC transporter substrate-binding protein PstS family protein [Planctomycetes bacterium]|nr:phosphate ABC transporter substrate-binding protein PstS family protein [Planctomycetota bacterium]